MYNSRKRIDHSMNITQRRAQLEQIIIEQQEIEIHKLNEIFDVSSVTLRNDLIFLERKGVCRRLFGKVAAESDNSYMHLNYNSLKNLEYKERIGKCAAKLIENGDSVLFYCGTTTQQIARFISPELNFIAVTNSIYIAQELGNLSKVRTILLGGLFNPSIGSTYGLEAIRQIGYYNIDKLFLPVDGIDAEYGITNSSPFESDINRAIIKQSSEVIVVADHTKIGNKSFIKMGDIEDVRMLITDSESDAHKIEELRSAGLEVVLAT